MRSEQNKYTLREIMRWMLRAWKAFHSTQLMALFRQQAIHSYLPNALGLCI